MSLILVPFLFKRPGRPSNYIHENRKSFPLEMWTVDHARDDSVQACTSLKNYPPHNKIDKTTGIWKQHTAVSNFLKL